ncbi:hypothetical protein [Ideonella sp.]|uniref:hypothetical protein n=1 Tax=Ideonella sp. TaxID=1929293 RepID=UPI003BB663A8
MGEAKRRGTLAQRVAGAAGMAHQAQAPTMACNACHAVLPDAEQMDASRLKGISLAFKAHCTACDLDTWAVRGDAAAVRAFYVALEKASEGTVQLGRT